MTSAIDWLADRFAGVPVVYVPGNHDFWCDADDRFTLDDMLARGRELAARRGIRLLSDDVADISGMRFVGATLWTDLRLGTRSLGHALGTSRRYMRDYRRIRRRPSGRHHYIRPVDTMALHAWSRAAIDGALAVPFQGPSVVVSHHAPHPVSLPDPHLDLRWCYASNLTSLIEARRPDLWVHGHLHNRSEYVVADTLVVANPRGHVDEPGYRDFDPSFVVETGGLGRLSAAPIAGGGEDG